MSDNENNNVFNIASAIAERRRIAEERRTETVVSYIPLPKPTISEVQDFIKVLGYLRQIAPDGSGYVRFDDFSARISLNANRIEPEDDIPQVSVGLAIEGVLPFAWNGITYDDIEDPEEEVTLEECAQVSLDIIHQLDSDEENPSTE